MPKPDRQIRTVTHWRCKLQSWRPMNLIYFIRSDLISDKNKFLSGQFVRAGGMRVNTRYINSARSPLQDVPLVEFMYLVFTRMQSESYSRQLRSLLLRLCDVFWVLINSLVCWLYESSVDHRQPTERGRFCASPLSLIVFQIETIRKTGKVAYTTAKFLHTDL